MNDERQRSRLEDDDSLLASVAGVPLTRSARIGACLVWAAFWAARILLTDALPYFNQGDWKSALLELIGENPFDQGFSICMAWLTIEVAIIAWNSLKRSIFMLIAKTNKKGFRQELAEALVENLPPENIAAMAANLSPEKTAALAANLPLERLEAIVEKRRKEAGLNNPAADAEQKD